MVKFFTDSHRASTAIEPYKLVAFDGQGGVKQATGSSEYLVGVLSGLVGVSVGQHADVHRLGIVKVKLGGTVSIGDEITSDASGQGVAVGASGGESVGRAEEGGVAGDIIKVWLNSKTIAESA